MNQDLKDHKDHRVMQDPLDLQDHKDLRVVKGSLDLEDNQVNRDQLDNQASKDHRV